MRTRLLPKPAGLRVRLGRRAASGAAWNLVGQVLPLLVAVACIPLLIREIGLERFGFIALAWVLVGYASLLDLGIGRALVRTVSARLAAADPRGAADSASTGLSFLLGFGLLLAAAMAMATPLLVRTVLRAPEALADEALGATWLLACSLPFVMLSGGYAGVLTAHQAFKPLNLVRALFGVFSYSLPLAVALAGYGQLPTLVAGILVLRVLGCAVFALACRRHCAWHWRLHWPRREITRELLALGGWMSVSNLVGPLLTSMDRLLIGALVPLRSVGLYSAPYDLLTRLMVFPNAIVAAVFPSVTSVPPGAPARQVLSELSRWLHLGMFPMLFTAMALAHPAMVLWLGEESGGQAAWVLQILVPGIYLNTLAQAPATLIQAAGRPRDMAVLHLLELPVFLLLLWALTERLGIAGTAAAATLRFAIDAAAVAMLAQRGLQIGAWPWRLTLECGAVVAGLLAAALLCRGWAASLALTVVGLVLLTVHGWVRVLRAGERQRLLGAVRQALGR